MAAKPCIRSDTAQTLTFHVPTGEGAPSSPTVVLYDQDGTQWTTTAPTATASGQNLTVTVPAGLVDDEAINYRARWTYTASSTTYVRDQAFDVRKQVFYATLDPTLLTTKYARLVTARYPSGVTSWQNEIDLAFEMIQDAIRAAGKDPHLVIDPRQFERAHAEWTAYLIARQYAMGDQTTDDRIRWAEYMHEAGRRSLEQALAHVDWYDEDQDQGADSEEEGLNANRTMITR